MVNKAWKTLAIIFIILFTLETSFLTFSIIYYSADQEKQNECYYDVCSGYNQVYYESNVCECYSINEETSEYELAKIFYFK